MLRRNQRVRERFLGSGKLAVFLLEFLPCRLLLSHFLLRAPYIADKQKDHNRRNCKNDRSEQSHMIPENIKEAIGIQPSGIPV